MKVSSAEIPSEKPINKAPTPLNSQTLKRNNSGTKSVNLLKKLKYQLHQVSTINNKKNNTYMQINHFSDCCENILDIICQDLSTIDIILLSMTCSTIRSKVDSYIYQDLRIDTISQLEKPKLMENTKHDYLWSDGFKNSILMLEKNIPIIKSSKSLLLLIYKVLTNPYIGSYIKSIELFADFGRMLEFEDTTWNQTLDNFLSIDEISCLENKFPFFNKSLTLFDSLGYLLDHSPNLEKFSAPEFTITNISKLILHTSKLKELDIMVQIDDCNLPIEKLRNLKKLTIRYEWGTDNQLSQLSQSLKYGDILKNLESLTLKNITDRFGNYDTPIWFSFFENLSEPKNEFIFKKLIKFELIDCFMGGNQREMINSLKRLIPFRQIKSLKLILHEYSHKGVSHKNCFNNNSLNHMNTTLSYLSLHLDNIEEISIESHRNCKICQTYSVLNFLTEHTTINKLWISINTLNSLNYQKMINIIQNQKNLKQLTYFDAFIRSKLVHNMIYWFISEHSLPINENEISDYFAREGQYQHNEPYFEGYISQSVEIFNERESDLMILFWQKFLKEFALDILVNNPKSELNDLKLFGYNFRIDRSRKVIMYYISKKIGYVDVIYF
ncbi:hypothetical protein DAPK24_007260 [Pichia kluyveri]|uniref:F-box domain-containing protein n=1 Tax=Pichia kluyveri TaxID=36015 RepID=A0AAV5QYW0_PICKL|nr:hypothetical protein DAPK24_007260 [Pichia kluyveri]